jgi:hypothetical protein
MKSKPKFYVVGSDKPTATKPSPFDDMEKLRASNQAAFEALAQQQPAVQRSKPRRILRSEEEFSRVPWHWLEIPAQENGYPAWVRLHLVLWYRTREGKEPIRLSASLAAEAGIHNRHLKWRELRELELRGLARVERDGNKLPVVLALPPKRDQE